MADLADEILLYLADKSSFNTLELANKRDIDHQKIVGAIKSIQAKGNLVTCDQKSSKHLELTAEGKQIAEHGSHEAVLYSAIPVHDGTIQVELMIDVLILYHLFLTKQKNVPNAKVGFSKAMAAGWIRMDKKAEGGARVYRKVDSIEDVVRKHCQLVADHRLDNVSDQQKAELRKRKLVNEVIITTYDVSKGMGLGRIKSFKDYNFNALGIMPPSGHLHPLLKVRTQFRQIFLEMGFSEMPTNNYVESSFWNFDALFQPQQHPARDAHDTFFISDPAAAHEFPEDYVDRVKLVHSKGGYGSQGYQYDWKLDEAAKNIMRTHTTAVSARMLYKLAQEDVIRLKVVEG
ncbi:hypothetical protein LSH36_855g00035 [Paralvinella palmiformis]|uniref:Uncharacterized protein n=1 Tax=Paralvinella palmiformis TaxID=53620 RepID=A0AAD9J0A3_9ANNE|nr:hypothetical protein LSH36_855g00035 [Paralvinella palmiformis]